MPTPALIIEDHFDRAARDLQHAVAADQRDGATRRYFHEHHVPSGEWREIMQRSVDLMMARSHR